MDREEDYSTVIILRNLPAVVRSIFLKKEIKFSISLESSSVRISRSAPRFREIGSRLTSHDVIWTRVTRARSSGRSPLNHYSLSDRC